MATYSNQHWLLSHIRNSFISTDDTGMCETVMVSDDLPKHFLRKFQSPTTTSNGAQQQPAAAGAHSQTNAQRKPAGVNGGAASVASGGNNGQSKNLQRTVADPPLQEVDFICYPGLDQSDDEDMDLSTQSFDIQMYPEVGAHRFRSNTAQKLEKMDIARRKAARTKCVNYDDEIIGPERNDLFVRKLVANVTRRGTQEKDTVDGGGASSSSDRCNTDDTGSESATPEKKLATNKKPAAPVIRSKLALQLANSPKQSQNKFMEYARFDGTSQTGVKTKRISVFLSMLPEKKRNYPIKICVVESAKIIEVIGLVCYKATIQFPAIPLKSIRHYGLYMTEDNDDMDDFPPLDNREPCSKFGFSHLTLAERRPLASVTRIEFPPNNNNISSEDNRGQRSSVNTLMQPIDTNSINQDALIVDTPDGTSLNDEEQGHHERLEAPTYRTYRLHIIDKRFFKTEVTLGISGERIEIDQHKNPKFWTKQKAVTYPIEAIAFCEIVERRNVKAILRIWLKSSSSVNAALMAEAKAATLTVVGGGGGGNVAGGNPLSPTSPGHYATFTSPFTKFSTIAGGGGGSSAGGLHSHIRFKHYDFEAEPATAEQIHTKLNCILDVRSSDVRREFLLARERKLEKSQAKKQLKMF